MKNLLLLLTISSAPLFAMDKGAREKSRAKAMSAGQPRAAIPRTQERTSFDSLFEPVPAPGKSPCDRTCICTVCLERAHAELERIECKLDVLKKMPDHNGPNALASARMVAKLLKVAKNYENSPMTPASSPRNAITIPYVALSIKADSPKQEGKLVPDEFTQGGSRLLTNSDEDDEFAVLTDPNSSSYKWRLRQVCADIP